MSTLKEIASELGVSHTLVSRVVSGRMGNTRVSEKTKQTILKRARELDYQPNRLALALKHGKKGVVGVFLHKVGTRGSELNERFIRAVSDSLWDKKLHLWLRFFEKDEEFLAACTQKLMREVDGLILAGIPHPDLAESILRMESQGLPIVCAFHEQRSHPEITNIQVDHELQAFLATRHLLDKGCRRIARFHRVENRYEGYLRAHREAGVTPDRDLSIDAVRFTYFDGIDCMRRLLETGKKFDGLVTESDAQAAGAIHHLVRAGKIGDFCPMVVGIDDSPIAEDCVIPLTSVTAEMEETARCVVEALGAKLDGEKVSSRLLSARLVERDSTRENRRLGV